MSAPVAPLGPLMMVPVAIMTGALPGMPETVP